MTIGNAFSQSRDINKFYTPEFEKVSVKPMCPATVPGAAVCMAYGTILTVKTRLNCVDKLAYFKSQTEKEDGIIHVYIFSVAEYDHDNEVVRCARPNEAVKTIMIDDMSFKDVVIHNMDLMRF